MDLILDHFDALVVRQRAFSAKAFGPDRRFNGLKQHILKECAEVEQSGFDLREWVDIVILSLDGAWRTGVYRSLLWDLFSYFMVTREWLRLNDESHGKKQTLLEMVADSTHQLEDIGAGSSAVTLSMEYLRITSMALMGCYYTGATEKEILQAIVDKIEKNEKRTWPDWRTLGDQAIEHVEQPGEAD